MTPPPPKGPGRKRRGHRGGYYNRLQFKINKTQQEKEQAEAILAASKNKVKVSGLPRFYSLNDTLLQSFLQTVKDDLKLNVVHTRFSKKGNAWLYLSFLTEKEQMTALEKLKRFTWQGRTLISTLVTTDELKRVNTEEGDDASAAKKQKIEIPVEEQVLMSQIPFHSIDYEEQLSKKHEEAHSLLARVRELMERQGSKSVEWCEKRSKELETDIPFVLEKIRPCPMINEYRNKYDFIIGFKPHLDKYGVGVRVKDAEDGTLQVGPIDVLRNLPKPMIQLAKIFDGYIDNNNHKHWVCLTVRKNSADEYMVIAAATNAPKAFKARGKPAAGISGENKQPPAEPFDPELLEQLKLDVTKLFTDVDFCKLKSVYLETEKGRAKSDHEVHHLLGEKHIKEKLHDLEFEISPLTFFRQNTSGTEVLCAAVEELAGLTKETTLLDLFCGSGSLSLTLAKKCKQVIGVEVLEANVKDAKKNAELNGIENCEFINGKIEDQIESIMNKLEDKEVVVVLDPPRSGIHAQIVKALRSFSFCKRFVYVCSNHKLPFRNLLDLSTVFNDSKAKNKAFNTDPFVPVRVIPVDMTPHSLRSELVIQCERLPKAELENPEPPPGTVSPDATKKKETPANGAKKLPPKKPGVNRQNTRGFQRNFPGNSVRGNHTRGTNIRPNNLRDNFRGSNFRGNNFRGNNFPGSNFRGGNRFHNPIEPQGPNLIGSLMESARYIDSIRDIERRAYEEGLVKGLERSAFQMGLAQGLNKAPEKVTDWDGPSELNRPGASGWNASSSGIGGNKWNSGGSPNISSARLGNSSTPNPWSRDFSQNVNSSFGKSDSPSFFSDRSVSGNYGSSPSGLGFSSSRNAGSSNMSVWDSGSGGGGSYGNSFGNSSFAGMNSLSSASFNGGANRSVDRFNSSMNSSRNSNFSSNSLRNNSGFKSPPSKARGGNNNRGNRKAPYTATATARRGRY